ncbi:MAG: hypothetical protein Q7N50_10770 [Armatimonadota bacterium]|nr:hypothetical protein [Armatimonadota bacterium]
MPIEMPGFTPTRSAAKDGNMWIVTVAPPPFMNLPPQSLRLTEDQYNRYLSSLSGPLLIQEALPELTIDEREILLSGIGPADWDRMFPPDEDE